MSKDVGVEAIMLAKKIEREQLVAERDWAFKALEATDHTDQHRLSLMRQAMIGLIWNAGEKDLGELAASYQRLANTRGSVRDKTFAQLFSVVGQNLDASLSQDSLTKTREALLPFAESDDWFVKHRALYLITQFDDAHAPNASLALRSAQDALRLIPNEQSAYVLEARILSMEDIAHLHNLLRNPEMAVAASKQQIELQKLAAQPTDGISLINNLIYSFNQWRDHATTKVLVGILLRLEAETQSGVPGLTALRAAQINNETGDFKEALVFAKQAASAAEWESIRESAAVSHIVALAGLGKTAEAEAALADLERDLEQNNRESGEASQKILYAKALLAAADGNWTGAQRLMNQRLDQSVQFILSTNNSDTATMLAALQNSKDRQIEREAALKREAELSQIALKRKTRITNLMYVVAGILLIMLFCAFAFAKYRSIAAAKMKLAAEKAEAGEKAKSEFLAVMSHELRTPLNGILGLADILSRQAPTQDLRDKNAIILQSGQDLLGLVENILDMTLIEGGDIDLYEDEIDVVKTFRKLEAAWRTKIESKDVIFTVHIADTVPKTLEIDPRRFEQCINNLLSNAAKFTLAGRVHLHVTADIPPQTEQATLTIIVADTGVGISDDAKTRLFQPFVQADSSMTRHYGGAGLGLAITRNLARMMGGDVSVQSREGRGSEFSFTLKGRAPNALLSTDAPVQDILTLTTPYVPKTLSTAAKSDPVTIVPGSAQDDYELAASGAQSSSGVRVLIVEDDLACQDVLRTLLTPAGCQISCVDNGQSAINILNVQTFDLILMDVRMPGMDGVTTVRRIRGGQHAHKDVPIIAITADVAAETNMKCKAAGVDVFLTKPIRSAELFDAIAYVNAQAEERAAG